MNEGKELRLLGRVLRELSAMAEEASLTGAMSEGAPHAVARYNQTVVRAEQLGAVPVGHFAPLPPGTSFGALAVEARILAAHLEDEEGTTHHSGAAAPDFDVVRRLAPFVPPHELGLLLRQSAKGGVINPEMLVSVAPFLGGDVTGQILRDYLESISVVPEAPAPPEPSEPPEPPEPPEPADTRASEGIARLASRLTSAGIGDEERRAILREIERIASQG